MKILVLSQYWFPEQGVPQRRWQWLVRCLIDQGAEVLVVAPPPHYRREKTWKSWIKNLLGAKDCEYELGPSGEKVLRCPYIPATNSLTQRVLNQFAVSCGMIWRVIPRTSVTRRFAPDLVIGTVPALPTAAVTYFISRLLKAPYIIDLRDAWPDLLANSDEWNRELGTKSFRQKVLERGPKQALLRTVECVLWGVYSRADAMLFTSRYLQEATASNLLMRGLSVPQSMLVRNVFPTPLFNINSNIELRKSEQGRELRILYAGTVGRAQNLNNLLKAISIATEEGVEVKAKILGKGDALPRLKATWGTLGGNVQFERAVAPEKLSEYYAWADCAVVHLAEWDALKRAVPSKTYELMENKIFILGAVDGETASLIQVLGAGEVVPPNEPVVLAEKIKELAQNSHWLKPQDMAEEWVKSERTRVEKEIIPSILGKK